jgi:hypothetical protein
MKNGVLNSRTNKRGDQIVDVQVLAPWCREVKGRKVILPIWFPPAHRRLRRAKSTRSSTKLF